MRGAGDANAKKTHALHFLTHEHHLAPDMVAREDLSQFTHMSTKTESRTACQAHTLQQNIFRFTVGADAGKPPLDQESLSLHSLLCRFCTVKLSFLFGNHFAVLDELDVGQAHCRSTGWQRHKESGIQSSKKIKQNNKLPIASAHPSKHSEGPSREQEYESARLLGAGARLMSTEQLFFSFQERTDEPKLASTRREHPDH